MKRKVTIQILGTQKYSEGQDERQELSVPGTYYEKNNAFYAVYKEPESVSGFEGVTTFLTLKKDRVALNRKGAVDLAQEFQVGVRSSSKYVTRYGKMWLSVLPQRVECDLTAQGGRISLEYDLFVDDNFVSHNLLWVTIKEDNPQ
ncbi:hypothetical protein Desaci_4656 [Desulfosporosinus acidiphilus SJ4]|uniref:DUF1934 domain-containing protein n=1 Tax=Desulfosporosinus acidiphilus (strain DSM 22704 / JCM 16185 / SJ4) TaxID=646529 RepID=I4DCG7_DESAJ|nr:DUF1934 domain-containing protein [Desulfosporosinus acidiphilus]AFM43491.1 hypothetical protein Desaci_4656 [Desulfosporosinus acidiphilus SJ4]